MVFVPAPNTPIDVPDIWEPSMELMINRMNTKAFIDSDPLTLSLTARGSARTPSGAYGRPAAAERPPQTFKLIMQSPAGASIEQRTEDGTERQVDFILLGEWDAQIAVGDFWDDEEGQRWQVTSLIPRNGYEVRAAVSANGKDLYGG